VLGAGFPSWQLDVILDESDRDEQVLAARMRRLADVVDPATEERLAPVPAASTGQVQAATTAAARSFRAWAALSGEERGDLLRRAADSLAGTIDADAAVMTREQGKTLAESRAEMTSIVELFRFPTVASLAARLTEEAASADAAKLDRQRGARRRTAGRDRRRAASRPLEGKRE